jgi:hypothetical protein
MKKIIKHYPMTGRLIVTRGYGSWVNNSCGTVSYGSAGWLTTTCAISAYHHWCCEFESRSGRGIQQYVIICLCNEAGWWFSPVSSINKTDSHNITEILLKVKLSTIKYKIKNRNTNSTTQTVTQHALAHVSHAIKQNTNSTRQLSFFTHTIKNRNSLPLSTVMNESLCCTLCDV